MGIQTKARLGHPRYGVVSEKVFEEAGKEKLVEIK